MAPSQTPSTAQPKSFKQHDFVFVPGTFSFGTDPAMTLITAELRLTDTLIAVTKQRIAPDATYIPITLTAVYNAKLRSLTIRCIGSSGSPRFLDLRFSEQIALYNALCETISQGYGKMPEKFLNERRAKKGLSPLP